jgi:aminoglycoside phosphotransferase (APT) family kinase protein
VTPTEDRPVERALEILYRSGHVVRQLQPAGSGSLHHLFVVEMSSGAMQLMRLARSHDLPTVMVSLRAEAEAIRRAHGIVPVAYPLLLVPDDGHPEASLSPIVPGTRAIDLRASAPQNPAIATLCQLLGSTLATLHTVRRPPGEPTHLPDDGRQGDPRGARLLHGDAHLGNLMIDFEKKKGYRVTGLVDWSFCHWGAPEADLVEMAICEAEPRPRLGYLFYKAYLDAGGEAPRREVFREVLARELTRRLHAHAQAHDPVAREVWTRWLAALQRPAVDALRVFVPTRVPGRDLG